VVTAPGGVGHPPGLDVLTEALDTRGMSRRLAPFVDGRTGCRVVAARLVGFAPQGRAVIAYRTAGAAGDAPALIGKTYADPERARRLHALLVELSALDLAGNGCGVARPVAHLPELRMVVFTASAGRSLDRLAGAEREAGVAAAGRWLSALHRTPVRLDRRLDLAHETRNALDWARLVVREHPGAATRTALLTERLASHAGHLPSLTTVPIHKDFHYQHVLLEQHRAVVIDLDEARGGDSGLDVAHFTTYLRLLALREHMAAGALARLEAAFLDGYGPLDGEEREARLRWFGAYTCLKIAKQLVRGRGPTPVPAGAERERQVELILDEGLRCLER
jgi:hypothetical protein